MWTQSWLKTRTMKTAEEFLDHISENGKYTFDWKEFGILFARYHVEQALQAAADNVELCDFDAHGEYGPDIDEESILNSYPLENIK
jgi:hypothetical protein